MDGKCKPDADADGVTDALDACPGTPSGTTVNAAGCSAGECFAPPADMVAWYPGDFNNNEIVGLNHGTTNGTVNFAAGEVNQAFQFSGATGNAVSASEQLAYQVTSFSVDAWVKIAAFPSAAQGSGMIFFRVTADRLSILISCTARRAAKSVSTSSRRPAHSADRS